MKRFVWLLAVLLLLQLCGCAAVEHFVEEAVWDQWQTKYDLGVRFLEEGDYSQAILAFSAAIEIDPRQAAAYAGRGDANARAGNYDDAVADYEMAVEHDSGCGDYYLTLSDLLLLVQEPERAQQVLERGCRDADDPAQLQDALEDLVGREEPPQIQQPEQEAEQEASPLDAYLQVVRERRWADVFNDGEIGVWACYCLYDLDRDGQQELLISDGITLHDYSTYVYGMQDGEAQYLGLLSGISAIYGHPEQNGVLLVESYSGTGFFQWLELEEGRVQCRVSETYEAGDPDTREELFGSGWVMEVTYAVDDLTPFGTPPRQTERTNRELADELVRLYMENRRYETLPLLLPCIQTQLRAKPDVGYWVDTMPEGVEYWYDDTMGPEWSRVDPEEMAQRLQMSFGMALVLSDVERFSYDFEVDEDTSGRITVCVGYCEGRHCVLDWSMSVSNP